MAGIFAPSTSTGITGTSGKCRLNLDPHEIARVVQPTSALSIARIGPIGTDYASTTVEALIALAMVSAKSAPATIGS